MAMQVPILEVNPVDSRDVSVAMVPVEDLDDFLEDLADDYDLGIGELGALSGGASITVKGSFKSQLAALHAAGKARVAAAIKAIAKARAKAKAAGKVRAKVKVKAKVKAKTKKIVVKAKAKARVKAKKKSASAYKKVKAVVRKFAKPAIKIAARVIPAIYPPVPLNKKALVHKAARKKTAKLIVATGAKLAPKAQHAVKAALHGKRKVGLAKPVATIVIALRRECNLAPAIIAQKKPVLAAAAGGQHTPTLQARYKAKKHLVSQSMPIKPKMFRIVVRGLLREIAARSDDPKVAANIKRIRHVTGVAYKKAVGT